MDKWSLAALCDEWWDTISDWSDMTIPRTLLAIRAGIEQDKYWEIPEPLSEKNRTAMRVLIEMARRTSNFPQEDYGAYIGPKNGDSKARVQWALWSAYNIGFETAMDAIRQSEDKAKG